MRHRYVVASQRPWNAGLADRLAKRTGRDFIAISQRDELTSERLAGIAPRFVFVSHWSDRIPDEVWQGHECVIFHMTDVPYGRGGSPLQNLIARGHRETVMSALRCVEDFDAGPVYLKRSLDLSGSAGEIFVRADGVIETMILEIVEREPIPVAQEGTPTVFKRLKPSDGTIEGAATLDKIYDHIRMLDGPGYPPAYLESQGLRLEFERAQMKEDHVEAVVRIRLNKTRDS
jgi:methionyl-tRNA formyltransferase